MVSRCSYGFPTRPRCRPRLKVPRGCRRQQVADPSQFALARCGLISDDQEYIEVTLRSRVPSRLRPIEQHLFNSSRMAFCEFETIALQPFLLGSRQFCDAHFTSV